MVVLNYESVICIKMESFRKLSNFFIFRNYFSTRLYEITLKKQFLWEPGKTNFKSFKFYKTGLEIKKILRSPSGDQLEKYSHQMQIFSCQFV